MKILFLTRYPEAGASSRYRVYQYLPHLREQGVKVRVSPMIGPALYALTFRPGKHVLKWLLLTATMLRRLSWMLAGLRFDLIVLQRECLPFGPPFMERWFRFCGKTTVLDIDDALYIGKSSTYNRWADWFRRPQKYREIFSLVNCVLAGNPYLRDQAAAYCTDARYFPVAEDLTRYPDKTDYGDAAKLRLVWLGSTSTEKYLQLIAPALSQLAREFPSLSLHIIGGGRFTMEGVNIEHSNWSLETEIALLQACDIGLMPLPLEEWSKGKCGGKARTYMAAGLPQVCTAIGYNETLIRHGDTGFLATTVDEWVDCLRRLIVDPALRQEIGQAARQEVAERYDLALIAPRYLATLRELADAA